MAGTSLPALANLFASAVSPAKAAAPAQQDARQRVDPVTAVALTTPVLTFASEARRPRSGHPNPATLAPGRIPPLLPELLDRAGRSRRHPKQGEVA